MHLFDGTNLSQEIFGVDSWGAAICSLGHGRKNMLMILPTVWRLGFKVVVSADPSQRFSSNYGKLFLVPYYSQN